MKKIISLALTLTLSSILFFNACMDLDKEPMDMISDKAVFEDEPLTMAYLYNIYGYMPCGFGLFVEEGGNVLTGMGITDLLDGSTDLLRSPAGWNESNGSIIPGLMSAAYNPLETWGRSYQVIRKVNNMLANLINSPLSDEFKTRVGAEARFVRAFMYFDLVRRYSDVPLIKELQNYDNLKEVMAPRTPKSEIYDFIDSELEEIADVLPEAQKLPKSELGRTTREAAWALNGRAMLFAERYERSATLSKRVIDLIDYFKLEPDYNKLFQSHGGSSEVIFEVLFDGTNRGHAADNLYMPPSLDNGWGSQSCPTQELVDSYEMLDGTSFDWSNADHAANPYEGRDKRLQASIIVDGAMFKNKEIRTGHLMPDDGLGLTERTITGYYIRKFMDETLPFEKLYFGGSSTSWKEIRMAEVLLNYAEAQNEANNGPDPSVYEAIRLVRERAGLPALPDNLNYSQMKERIIHERKIELAFEGHRFWDLRRWRIAESVLNNKFFHGVKITEDDNKVKKYEIFEVNTVPRQAFLPKHYLMPINQGEMDKNPALEKNNPGY